MFGIVKINTFLNLLLVFLLVASTAAFSTTLEINNPQVSPNDELSITINGVSGDRDWVGIYRKNDSNSWSNVLSWDWVGNGTSSINGVANPGNYEARLFFHNSYRDEAKTAFSVTSLSILASSVETIDQNSVYVYFDLSQKAQATIEYGTTTEYGQFTIKETSFDYASHRQRVYNLEPGTLYHYRVHAFDEAGNEVVSQDATFRTDGMNDVFGQAGIHPTAYHDEVDASMTRVYYPTDIPAGEKVPVVFFASGYSSSNATDYESLLRFIASHGYYVIYAKHAWDNVFTNLDKMLDDANGILPKLDTTRIGVMGHSLGAGYTFNILKYFSDKGYGENGRFIMALEAWYAFNLNKDELQHLPSNTNVVMQQYGVGGNNDANDTDPRIPLTEFYLLDSIPNNQKDWQIIEGVNHGYPSGNKPYSQMQGILKPLDALMEYTFKGTASAHDEALEQGSDDPYNHGNGIQIVNPTADYSYQCDDNVNLGIDYCDMEQWYITLSILSSRVEEIDQNSVYVYFDLNQKAQATVEYGTTTAYGQFTTKETSFDYASHRQRVFNLEPGTFYHYRVHAFDEAGNEVISEDATFSTSGSNNNQHLILMDGFSWGTSRISHMVENHEALEQLPFSGFVVHSGETGSVGFTYDLMSSHPDIDNNFTYDRVWNEVKPLKNIFQVKTDNFLRVNVGFPGDFWDDVAWNRVASNFAAVAKAAKNIGFKGILFDDEVYTAPKHENIRKMVNFRFPRKDDVVANPQDYEQWEIDENASNRGPWQDYNCRISGLGVVVNSDKCSYRNPDYTFKEHMNKLTARFKSIMEAMRAEYPDITVLVLHGPSTGHAKTNVNGHYIKPNSLYRMYEFMGPMFVGFKQGLAGGAELHDLGEFYAYSSDAHFENAYQWRKYDIASEQYNLDLDDNYQWVIPVADRASWSQDVGVGFMISDYDMSFNARGGYDTSNQCMPVDVESRLTHAFNNSDGYVIYYPDSSLSSCDKNNPINWQNIDAPIRESWLDMMQGVFDSIQ